MITCKSPLKVLEFAHEFACGHLPEHGSKFSRHDFTRPQLLARLMLGEHRKKSYRGLVALPEDSPGWREAVGLSRTPDYRTPCRPFGELVKPGLMNRMMDDLVAWADDLGLVEADRVKPMTMDSTTFESRHVSRHFEKRQPRTAAAGTKKVGKTATKAGRRRTPPGD